MISVQCAERFWIFIVFLSCFATLGGGNPYGVVANVLDYDSVKSTIELQSCYYIHFWTNALKKRYKYPYSSSYKFNSTTDIVRQG